jgi:hypothetical protein
LKQNFAPLVGQRGGNHEQYRRTIFHILTTSQGFDGLCGILMRLATGNASRLFFVQYVTIFSFWPARMAALDDNPFSALKRSFCSDGYAMRAASVATLSRGPAVTTRSLRGFTVAACKGVRRDMLENIWSNGFALAAVIVTK